MNDTSEKLVAVSRRLRRSDGPGSELRKVKKCNLMKWAIGRERL